MKSQIAQLQKKQTLLKIFIFTLVTIMVWVGLSLFRTQQETGISPHVIQLAEPLNPNISTDIIDQIQAKRAYTPEELADFPIYSLLSTKNGEQELVVFSASDKTKKAVGGTPTDAAVAGGAPTTQGTTVTVQPGTQATPAPATPPADGSQLPAGPAAAPSAQ